MKFKQGSAFKLLDMLPEGHQLATDNYAAEAANDRSTTELMARTSSGGGVRWRSSVWVRLGIECNFRRNSY